jgi:hypothetical protein
MDFPIRRNHSRTDELKPRRTPIEFQEKGNGHNQVKNRGDQRSKARGRPDQNQDRRGDWTKNEEEKH